MTGTRQLSPAKLDLNKESDHLTMTFLLFYKKTANIPLSFSQLCREIDKYIKHEFTACYIYNIWARSHENA